MIWMFKLSQIIYDDKCFMITFDSFNCVMLWFMNGVYVMLLNVHGHRNKLKVMV